MEKEISWKLVCSSYGIFPNSLNIGLEKEGEIMEEI
jgi:hypothetical protein